MWYPKVLALGLPVLGICYGMQWITHTLGGKVEKAERREYGRAQLQVVCQGGPENSALFAGVPTGLRVWNSHGDHVRALPAGFRTVGRTENAVAAVEDAERKIYAVEFHPEVKHTERGTELLRNFLFRVCKAEPKWSGAAFIDETTAARSEEHTSELQSRQYLVCRLLLEKKKKKKSKYKQNKIHNLN